MVSDLKPCTYDECKISAQQILPSTDTINWPALGVTFLSISNTKVINFFFLPGSIAHFPPDCDKCLHGVKEYYAGQSQNIICSCNAFSLLVKGDLDLQDRGASSIVI